MKNVKKKRLQETLSGSRVLPCSETMLRRNRESRNTRGNGSRNEKKVCTVQHSNENPKGQKQSAGPGQK